MQFPHFKNELKCLKEGFSLVAGCDEAGGGPPTPPGVVHRADWNSVMNREKTEGNDAKNISESREDRNA